MIRESILEDKNFMYKLKKAKDSMLYFDRWRHGRLRCTSIRYQPLS